MGRVGLIFISRSPEETLQFGYEWGKKLKSRSLLFFAGDLAAGKTTFIKGIVSGATGLSPMEVNSPTFVILNCYEGAVPVYHFDLYRLKGPEEFIDLGFEEYFGKEGICCVEWSERIQPLIPLGSMSVTLRALGPEEREIKIIGGEK